MSNSTINEWGIKVQSTSYPTNQPDYNDWMIEMNVSQSYQEPILGRLKAIDMIKQYDYSKYEFKIEA